MHEFYFNQQLDKALAIGILLICLLSGFMFFKYVYINQIAVLIDEIEFTKKKTAKVNSIISNEKKLRQKIKIQKSNIQKNNIFLTNNDPATAASELQNYLKKLVATHSKAKILAIKPYPVLAHDEFFETTLEIRIKDISHKEIQKIIYFIEKRTPVLLLKELDIKRTQLRYKALVNSEKKQINLGLIMVVSGFFRGA